ncbi:DUF2089 domain-containing protein [bacterium]|nr:DUF2089 domain-containing protein [bacterium]
MTEKQNYPAPEQCPVCSDRLFVRELACHGCGTRIKGDFEEIKPPFTMDDELFNFIKVFIFAEGSIKQSEKMLNCSYPKIKNLLKKSKVALGFTEDRPESSGSIIDQLDQGRIDIETALEKLQRP